NRAETIANLLQALNAEAGDPARTAWFSALGFGYLLLEGVFEAMDHLPQLLVEDFWSDVVRALEAAESEPCRNHLVAAAERLRQTREILYPNNVYFADLILLNDLPLNAAVPLAISSRTPSNVIVSGQHLERLASANPQLLQSLRAGMQNDSLDVCSGP